MDQNFGDTERSKTIWKMDYFVPFRIQCDKRWSQIGGRNECQNFVLCAIFPARKRANLCAQMATIMSIPRCQCHVMVILAPFLTSIAYLHGLLDRINSASGLVRDIAQCDVCFVSRFINNTIHICLHTQLLFFGEIITGNIILASIESSILCRFGKDYVCKGEHAVLAKIYIL